MQLYIVRHAWAGPSGDPSFEDDDLRPLTDEGRKRFGKVVKKLAKRGFSPPHVATSPLVRCTQTADVLAEHVTPTPQITPLDALAPNSQLRALIEWTNSLGGEDAAWVGHAPDVGELASALISDGTARIRFRKGAVLAILFDGPVTQGKGELSWMATAALLGE